MKYRGDAGLLREAVEHVGLECGTIYSDYVKGGRRLKLYTAEELFAASPEVQEAFMERLKHNFGNRVVKYHSWISSSPYNFQSFVIVVTEDQEVRAERQRKYAAAFAATQAKRDAQWEAMFGVRSN